MRLEIPKRRARGVTFTSAALLSLTTLAVAALSAALFPRRLPPPHDSYVIDVIFGSQTVIWGARMLLVSAAFVLVVGGAFVVVSTVVRMRNGDWLRRAGPFEVSETRVAELEDQVHLWQSAAHDYYDELARIRKLDTETDELEKTSTPDDDYDKL